MTENMTAVGRIVWGNPLKGRGKTDRNKQPVLKDGKQVTQWAFGVAIPKADFFGVNQSGRDAAGVLTTWGVMAQAAMTLFPSGQFPPLFAWKYDDGDGVDGNGKPFRDREGYAGNIILAISTEAFQPQVVRLVNGVYIAVTDTQIKTGDWVRANIDIQPHGPNPTAPGSQSGLYINPRLIELIGEGDAIVSGPDPSQVFGGQQVALPPGARPIGSAPPAPSMPMPIAAPQAAPGPIPAPITAPVAVPVAPTPVAPPPAGPGAFAPPPILSPTNPVPPVIQPHPTFVPQALQAPPPPAPVAPVAPPAPATPQYTIPAGSPIPAGYRYVGTAADGQWLITTP